VSAGPAGRLAAELVIDAHAWLGEGPLWDARRGVLWWLDILAGVMHAFDPATGQDTVHHIGPSVGMAAFHADGRLLLGLPDGIAALDPGTGTRETIARFPATPAPLRCNDGAADPEGRLLVGRIALGAAPGAGSLLRIERDGTVSTVLDGLTIPNGLAWPAAGSTFAYVDSARRTVDLYPRDPATGALGSPSSLVSMDAAGMPAGAVPDGMALDVEDHLWVAVWGGACVLRVSPAGEVVARVDVPVSQPSSCAFGGPDLGDLYITSAREGFGEEDEAREPHAGGLFRVRPGVAGLLPGAYRPA
jgi:sugar lactone lactonase YvrE